MASYATVCVTLFQARGPHRIRLAPQHLVHGGWPEMQRQLTQMFTHSPHMRPSAAQRLPRAWSMACKHAWWTCMACRHTAALLDMRYCTCIVAHANSHCSTTTAAGELTVPRHMNGYQQRGRLAHGLQPGWIKYPSCTGHEADILG